MESADLHGVFPSYLHWLSVFQVRPASQLRGTMACTMLLCLYVFLLILANRMEQNRDKINKFFPSEERKHSICK